MWKYVGVKECNEFLLSLNLFNCKNKNKYIKTLYSITNDIESNYKIYKIKKNNGSYRTIYEPMGLLKKIQRKVLANTLNTRTISKYAKAYHKGLSLKDNALPHVNKKIILKLDIENFFESISFFDVYLSCFSLEYYPKSLGMLLTYLCTYRGHLTQGSPTSAYISNLVMSVTGVVVNEKAQVSAQYRREIRKEMYYISKYGLASHLKRYNVDMTPEDYLNKLRGKILYVLQIDKKNEEFLRYKKAMDAKFWEKRYEK